MNEIKQIVLNVHIGNEIKTINHNVISGFAAEFGLDRLIPNRYSWLLVIDMIMNLELNGIDPAHVVDEIRRLEDSNVDGYTKQATQFKHAPLYPLWHQHYFSAHYLVDNIQNELRRKGTWEGIFNESLGSEGSLITKEQMDKLIHEAVEETVQKRSNEERVTGEWLVFAKAAIGNIYLCMATHEMGDQNIFDKLAYACKRQFPTLEPFA